MIARPAVHRLARGTTPRLPAAVCSASSAFGARSGVRRGWRRTKDDRVVPDRTKSCRGATHRALPARSCAATAGDFCSAASWAFGPATATGTRSGGFAEANPRASAGSAEIQRPRVAFAENSFARVASSTIGGRMRVFSGIAKLLPVNDTKRSSACLMSRQRHQLRAFFSTYRSTAARPRPANDAQQPSTFVRCPAQRRSPDDAVEPGSLVNSITLRAWLGDQPAGGRGR